MSISNPTKELTRNTIIFAVGTLGAKFVMLILMPIYTSYLTQSELGIAELVVNCMNIIYPIATFNILSALLRFGLDKEYKKEEVLQNTFLIVFVGLLLVLLIVLSINIKSVISLWKPYLLVLLFSYTIEQVLSVFAKVMDMTLEFAIGNIVYTISLFILSVLLIVALDRGTAGYLEAIIISNFITFVYFLLRISLWKYIKIGSINTKLLKEMFFFSMPLIINSVSWWLASFSDRFILERIMGTNEVGLYSAASKIPAIITAVSAVFMQAWVISAIKEYQNSTDKTFFSNIFQKFNSLFLTWTAFILCFCKVIVQLISKGDFSTSWVFVPLLICGAVFGSYAGFFSAFYTSAKKNTEVMVTTLLAAIVNIGLNIFLIPKFGIQGAVFATMLSQLLMAMQRMVGSLKFIDCKINMKKFLIEIVMILLLAYASIINVFIIYRLLMTLVVIAMSWKDLYAIMKHMVSRIILKVRK